MEPRGIQKGSQNREKIDLGPKMIPSWFQEGPLPMWTTPWPPLGVIFGSPRGPQNRPKRLIFGENVDPRAVIFSIFARKVLQPTFSSIFH